MLLSNQINKERQHPITKINENVLMSMKANLAILGTKKISDMGL